MKYLCILLFLGMCSGALAQRGHSQLRFGDRLYDEQAYEAAEEQYRDAIIKQKSNSRGLYNLGNSLYQQERLKEAINQYERYAEQTSDSSNLHAAHYNAGNAYFALGEFDKSIDAYKKALKLHPEDLDAKKNLLMALSQMRQQQQQQQQQNDQQEKEEQENQPEQNPGSGQQQEREKRPPSQNGTEKEAKELLQIVEKEDQRVQEKLRKSNAEKKKIEKDW